MREDLEAKLDSNQIYRELFDLYSRYLLNPSKLKRDIEKKMLEG
ncbi:MAG: hypothetical protein QXY49_01435 [Thermofilaceae archaeon]